VRLLRSFLCDERAAVRTVAVEGLCKLAFQGVVGSAVRALAHVDAGSYWCSQRICRPYMTLSGSRFAFQRTRTTIARARCSARLPRAMPQQALSTALSWPRCVSVCHAVTPVAYNLLMAACPVGMRAGGARAGPSARCRRPCAAIYGTRSAVGHCPGQVCRVDARSGQHQHPAAVWAGLLPVRRGKNQHGGGGWGGGRPDGASMPTSRGPSVSLSRMLPSVRTAADRGPDARRLH
jgi:hypothetical protein